MISLEMIGFYCVQEGCQKSPVPAIEGVFTPPTVGDSIVLATTAAHTGLAQRLESAMNASCAQAKTFRFDIAPVPVPDLMRSDHAPFLLAGFPALMLTDTANFRNPNYHSPKDTIDTLDTDRYGASVRALAGAIEALAGVEPPAPR
jgi:Zn-dependent M28 family amino/carboxypeptidase